VTAWEAIILGLVEGLTEYLPISSTGHLVLARELLGLGRGPALDAFIIVVQGGAVLAVLGLYRERVAQMIRGVLGRDRAGLRLAINLFVAFLPAAALGLVLEETIERYLLGPWPVVGALALGGVIMIGIGPWLRARGDAGAALPDVEALSWRQALAIGLAQCLALWPGTSRSLVTIVAGMVAGLRPAPAAEFSFLLALPTLGGACAYKGLKLLRGGEDGSIGDIGWIPVLLGLTVAAISAALAARWLVAWLTRHGLALFGWYRLVVAALYGWLA
jgi:undecaprenyl-diphosphatase